MHSDDLRRQAMAFTVYHDGKPVITASEACVLVDEAVANPRSHVSFVVPSIAMYSLLDGCMNFELMDRFIRLPQNCLRHLLACDRYARKVPFLRLAALEGIVVALIAQGRSSEGWKDRHVVMARDCMQHLDWRYKDADAVVVRRGGAFDGVYHRDPAHIDDTEVLQYEMQEATAAVPTTAAMRSPRGTGRRVLTLPVLSSAHRGIQEPYLLECKVTKRQDGRLLSVAHFTSECTDKVGKGFKLWAGRKDCSAFPDYDPREDEYSRMLVSDLKLSVFERYPTYLPHSFSHEPTMMTPPSPVPQMGRWQGLRAQLCEVALHACAEKSSSNNRKRKTPSSS